MTYVVMNVYTYLFFKKITYSFSLITKVEIKRGTTLKTRGLTKNVYVFCV